MTGWAEVLCGNANAIVETLLLFQQLICGPKIHDLAAVYEHGQQKSYMTSAEQVALRKWKE